MRIRDALLSARSYLTILIGFLLGFAIVVWVEKQMPARVESSGGMTLSQDFPPLPAPRELTFDEAIWARVAWQYYVNNTQPNGLANAQDRRLSATSRAICPDGRFFIALFKFNDAYFRLPDELQLRFTVDVFGTKPVDRQFGLPRNIHPLSLCEVVALITRRRRGFPSLACRPEVKSTTCVTHDEQSSDC